MDPLKDVHSVFGIRQHFLHYNLGKMCDFKIGQFNTVLAYKSILLDTAHTKDHYNVPCDSKYVKTHD